MPPLDNQRHERFCQALVEGRSASAAYIAAGYKGNTANAARLKAAEAVKRRIAELGKEAAERHEITLEGVLRDLDEAVATARSKGHATAMINAAALRSRLGGLLIDKSQVEVTDNTSSFDDCDNLDEIARKWADSELDGLTNARWRLITERDRTYLAELYMDFAVRSQEFLQSIENRPRHTEDNPIITIAKPVSNGG